MGSLPDGICLCDTGSEGVVELSGIVQNEPMDP